MGDFSLHRQAGDAFLSGKRRQPTVVPYRAKGNNLLSRKARNEARKLLSLEDAMYLWDGICQLCFKPIEDISEASRDHIRPIAKGGDSDFDNLQLSHRTCNTSKGSHDYDEYLRYISEQRDIICE